MVHLIPTLTRTLHQQYPHLYRMNMSIINIPNHKTMKPINRVTQRRKRHHTAQLLRSANLLRILRVLK